MSGASDLHIQLMTACKTSNKEQLEALLRLREVSAWINQPLEGFTALCHACSRGTVEIVQLLLNHGASQAFSNQAGFYPLHLASMSGNIEMMALLLSEGENINVRDRNGWRPLDHASARGHFKAVKMLLDRGAEVPILLEGRSSVLHLACQSGSFEVVQLLLGTDVKTLLNHRERYVLGRRMFYTYTPLFAACTKHDVNDQVVKLLLIEGACRTQLLRSFQNRQMSITHLLREWISSESTRWYRRSSWLHALQVEADRQRESVSGGAGGPELKPEPKTSEVDGLKRVLKKSRDEGVEGDKKAGDSVRVDDPTEADVKVLLTDPRLVRVERDSKLVYSLIVGKAAQFLSGCCEEAECPKNEAVLHRFE